jgi:SnoaL-like domain
MIELTLDDGVHMDDLLEFARGYTAAWCSGDPQQVADHYSRDGSLTINGGAPSVGRAAITEAARGFMDGFPDLRVEMDDLKIGGDSPEYHWTLTGTNTGPGGTGGLVRISGFEQWTMSSEGLIAASVGSFDAAEWDRQVNIEP